MHNYSYAVLVVMLFCYPVVLDFDELFLKCNYIDSSQHSTLNKKRYFLFTLILEAFKNMYFREANTEFN